MIVMAQASVLTDTEIKRVFRIIETTRHANRNRLAFVLSIYAGLRVGEIAALTVSDVLTVSGDVRREIKLGAHQTKGSKGRTVVLSARVRSEIDADAKAGRPAATRGRGVDRRGHGAVDRLGLIGGAGHGSVHAVVGPGCQIVTACIIWLMR